MEIRLEGGFEINNHMCRIRDAAHKLMDDGAAFSDWTLTLRPLTGDDKEKLAAMADDDDSLAADGRRRINDDDDDSYITWNRDLKQIIIATRFDDGVDPEEFANVGIFEVVCDIVTPPKDDEDEDDQ